MSAYLPPYLAGAVDDLDETDRRDQAHELEHQPDPCTCRHDPEDHWPHEGCVRRECLCWWWAQ